MSYKLVPRFNYTLPFHYYFKLREEKKGANTLDILGTNSSVYHFNQARVGLRVLLNSISSKKLNVGVQAFTCHTVFQAIHNSGNNIVFIDLTDDFKLDLNDLSKKITKIDVLIITHTFGFPDYMDEIKKMAKDKIIIEDCSHSFLSKYGQLNTGKLGDASIFSTGLAKFPPVGEGGFLIINSKEKFPLLEEQTKKIPKTGFYSEIKSFVKTLIFSLMMHSPLYGLITYRVGKKLDSKMDFGNKFSFDEKMAPKWVKNVFLKNQSYFKKLLIKQQGNAQKLYNLIEDKSIIPIFDFSGQSNSYIFPLLINNRNNVFNNLLINGIEAGKHFSKSTAWAKEFGYQPDTCPNAEKLKNKILTVPVHAEVSELQIKKIASLINEYAER